MSIAISRIVGAHLVAAGLFMSVVSVYGQEAPARSNPQQNPPRQNQAQPRRPGAAPLQTQQRITANRPVDQARTADRDIAEWLGICNQEEVAMAKLAASKAQNKDVKQFAETLAKEHNQQLANLQKFGAQIVALDAGSNANRQAEAPRAPNAPGNQATTQTRTTGAQGGLDFLAAKREIAQRCLASAQEKWNSEKSEECEMGFVGAQLVMHEQMLTTAEVLKQHASPELQAAIEQGIQAAETHKKHAKELLHTLAAAERKADQNK